MFAVRGFDDFTWEKSFDEPFGWSFGRPRRIFAVNYGDGLTKTGELFGNCHFVFCSPSLFSY
jgi:hypothetical protein